MSPPKSLTKRKEFTEVLKNGVRFEHKGLTVCVLPRKEGELRLSVVVPKKLDKRAVKRNRLKRLVKEYFRLKVKPRLSGCDVVVIARGMEIKNLKDINDGLLQKVITASRKAS